MTLRPIRHPAAASLAVTLLAGLAAAAETPSARAEAVAHAYDALSAVKEFSGVALSPDVRFVAWVEAEPTEPEPRRSSLWVKELGSPKPARWVSAPAGEQPHSERAPAWSPDSRTLAFVAGSTKRRGPALCLVPATGGPVRTLVRMAGTVEGLRFSADGRSVAFLHIADALKDAGPLGLAARDAGVVGEKPDVQRIAVVDTDSGALRFASPPDLYVYEFDLSRDGRLAVGTAAPPPGDNNWWTARLFTFETSTGRANEVYAPKLQIACPRLSPDGRTIALLEGLMSDFGATSGEILTMPAAGGPARNLTPGRKSSPAWIAWLSGPERILLAENDGGTTAVRTLAIADGASSTLRSGMERLSSGDGTGLSIGRDGAAMAVIRDSFSEPPEIWAGPIAGLVPVTRRNADIRPQWEDVKSLWWEQGGTRVQGWLLPPKGFDPSRLNGTRYPLAVFVHGGPAGAHQAGWPFILTGVLAASGYFVFLPNPRGSFGQGQAFTRGNVKDFGYGDLADILAGVDEVLRTAPVDEKRMGLFGWSYGGYMAMWAATQTRRFGAIVAGAGISNWQSYYGTNRIDQWMIPYFGASVYDDPAVYARSSPITFIKTAAAPTLILHGERDAEAPASQGYEFWHALKTLGVPTQLVIYADEGHSIRKPANKKDRVVRTVGWFDTHLGPPSLRPAPAP